MYTHTHTHTYTHTHTHIHTYTHTSTHAHTHFWMRANSVYILGKPTTRGRFQLHGSCSYCCDLTSADLDFCGVDCSDMFASLMNTGCLCSNVPFKEEIYNIKKSHHNRPLSSICGKFKFGHADFRMFKWKQVPEPPSWISTILFSDFRKH